MAYTVLGLLLGSPVVEPSLKILLTYKNVNLTTLTLASLVYQPRRAAETSCVQQCLVRNPSQGSWRQPVVLRPVLVQDTAKLLRIPVC